jgi:hypothetical protein
VALDNRAALLALLDETRRCAAAGQPTEKYIRISHVSGDGARMQPVELKACTDGGDHIYCVFLDARIPARLESILPQARCQEPTAAALAPERADARALCRASRSFCCPQVRRAASLQQGQACLRADAATCPPAHRRRPRFENAVLFDSGTAERACCFCVLRFTGHLLGWQHQHAASVWF